MSSAEDTSYNTEWQHLEKALGTRPCFSGDITTIRAQFDSVGATIGPQFPPRDESVVKTEDRAVSPRSNPAAPPLGIRIYTPVNAGNGSLPMGVYFHGGGFVMGNLETEDADCCFLAQNVPCIIVSVDYRLAPENAFGDILEDAKEAVVWAHSNAAALGASPTSLFTIGASAGACLALSAVKQLLSESSAIRIGGIVALCPVTAHTSSLPEKFRPIYNSYITNATNVPIVSAAAMETFFDATKVKHDDGRLFVSLGLEDLVHSYTWPRTSIVTADKDPLRDDGTVLEAILKSATVVKRRNYEGLPHCFWIFPNTGIRDELLKYVVEQIKWVLE